jgi:folate-binding protein YgfZ
LSASKGLVWVDGPDAVVFLDSLLSQNIVAMASGATAPSLLLAPNGKLRATLSVLRGDARLGLVCDAGVVDAVVSDLSHFKIRVAVEIAVAERPVWDIWGPQVTQIVEPVPPLGEWRDDAGTLVVPVSFRHSALPRVIVAGSRPDLPVFDVAAAEPVRVELGEPVMGVDLDDTTIPQEGVDVAEHVDFGKGCYLGQELVARIDSRGHVNRRLRGLIMTGNEVPRVGSSIEHDGKVVGKISSAAWSEGLPGAVAMGMIRVEMDPGARVTTDMIGGTVVDLPIRG